jgi:hypothetical protein
MEIGFVQVEFSIEQADFLKWCQSHWQHLRALKDSGVLDIQTGSYTAHVKDKRLEIVDISNRFVVKN